MWVLLLSRQIQILLSAHTVVLLLHTKKKKKKKINHGNNHFCMILVCQSVYMTKYLNVFWDISFCN